MWRARLHSSWVLALRTASVPSLCDDTVGPSASRSIALPGSVIFDICRSLFGLVQGDSYEVEPGTGCVALGNGWDDPGSLTQGR
jgi:hypothetical protein